VRKTQEASKRELKSTTHDLAIVSRNHVKLSYCLTKIFAKIKNLEKMLRRSLAAALMCPICFLHIAPCLTIAGCSLSFDFDTEPTPPRNVEASTRAREDARAASERSEEAVRVAAEGVARADAELAAGVEKILTEIQEIFEQEQAAAEARLRNTLQTARQKVKKEEREVKRLKANFNQAPRKKRTRKKLDEIQKAEAARATAASELNQLLQKHPNHF
jgi:hypothetical protein